METAVNKYEKLDQLDLLIGKLRPIEALFRVMGAVGDQEGGAELARSCSEIGISLTASLREELARMFRRDGEAGQEE